MNDESSEHQGVLAERREKLERLREGGVDPFPHDYDDRTEIAEELQGALDPGHSGLVALVSDPGVVEIRNAGGVVTIEVKENPVKIGRAHV